MAGAKFQYDESGGTSFYFLLSFLALVVIPCTYYFWPKEEKESKEKNRNVCNCDPCSSKLDHIKANEPWKNVKRNLIKILILFGWIVMIATAYKCDHLQNDTVPWDPFQILEIPPGSSTAEIKKAYRKLSLIYHPDKETGSQEHFVKITKAYAALTDETARKNWEQYGNPDGPGATSFGIALPSWIVEKENSLIVLGLYALVFMIALPTVVGIWWYRSIKFNGDQVLLDTSQVYYYFIHKTDNMMIKRIIAVIAASLEFEKNHNSEIVERPTDQKEIMALIKEIPQNLGESNKEKPLCYPYSIKARALIFAHLSRLKLPPKTLEQDKIYIVKKIPTLVQEFVFNVAQLTMLSLAGRIQRMPSLETIENAMKFCAMAVQATWEYRNQLLQLPHINTNNLKFFSNKKRTIRTIQQLALLRDEERRSMLSYLSDNQYEDIINVIKKMPLLKVTAKPEVLDDEDTGLITAGAIVTVTVTLERKNMEIYVNKSKNSLNAFNQEDNNDEENQLDKANKASDENDPSQKQKPPVWKKVAKKGKNKGKKKGTVKKMPFTKQSNNQPAKKSDEESDSSNSNDSDNENEKEDNNSDVPSQENKIKKKDVDSDEDDDWDKFQEKVLKKDKTLESKPKHSHSVHCPFFYDDKQENWWIYMVDRKRPALVTVPVLMTSLVDYEEIELKFTAPSKPGIYKFEVIVRSDSYVDFSTTINLKLEVLKEKTYETPLQWDLSEESEDHSEDDDAVEDSDLLESDNDISVDSDDSEDDSTLDDSA